MAGINIVKENMYIGLWSAMFDGGDYLAVAWKTPTGPWEATYRFRYHVDEKVWHSEDEKHWYTIRAEDGSDMSMRAIRDALHLVFKLGQEMRQFTNGSYVECMGDGDAMTAILMSGDRPNIHRLNMTEEEHQAYLKAEMRQRHD